LPKAINARPKFFQYLAVYRIKTLETKVSFCLL